MTARRGKRLASYMLASKALGKWDECQVIDGG